MTSKPPRKIRLSSFIAGMGTFTFACGALALFFGSHEREGTIAWLITGMALVVASHVPVVLYLRKRGK